MDYSSIGLDHAHRFFNLQATDMAWGQLIHRAALRAVDHLQERLDMRGVQAQLSLQPQDACWGAADKALRDAGHHDLCGRLDRARDVCRYRSEQRYSAQTAREALAMAEMAISTDTERAAQLRDLREVLKPFIAP